MDTAVYRLARRVVVGGVCLLTVVAAVSAPSRASAAPRKHVHSEAEEQYRRGKEALDQGKFRDALDRLRVSQELEPGRGKLYLIATCEDRMGLVLAASVHYRQVTTQLDATDDRIPMIKARIEAMDLRVPRIKIELPPGTTDVAVTLDGNPLPWTVGGDIPVDPGPHVVTVAASNLLRRRYDVSVVEGRTTVIAVETGAKSVVEAPITVPNKPPPPKNPDVTNPDVTNPDVTNPDVTNPDVAGLPVTSPEAKRPESKPFEPAVRLTARGEIVRAPGLRTTVGLVAGGVGLTGIVVGGITGLLSLQNHSDAVTSCPTHQGCSPTIVERARSGRALGIASTVAFAVGAAGAGAGVYLLLLTADPMTAPAVGIGTHGDDATLTFRRAF